MGSDMTVAIRADLDSGRKRFDSSLSNRLVQMLDAEATQEQSIKTYY